jgi:hypothetical protein
MPVLVVFLPGELTIHFTQGLLFFLFSHDYFIAEEKSTAKSIKIHAYFQI